MRILFNKIFNNIDNRNIINNILGAFLVRGGALVVSMLTIPAFMNYFDDNIVLGLWFTLLSILSWVLMFDLGIGNGLRNQLVPALVKNNHLEIKKYVSSSYIIIGVVVLFSILLSIVTFEFINWNKVLNITEEVISHNTLKITVGIIFIGIMFQLFFKLITSVLYAMQKSALINFITLTSNVIVLIFVSLVKTSDISLNLILLAIIYVLAINVPLIITTIIIFNKSLKECKPAIKYFDITYAKSILKLGGVFFCIQIMYMIITATNDVLITWLSGPEDVVEYQIYNKLFTLIGTIFTLMLTPIWSAITKAIAENKFIWIKKLYKLLLLMAVIAIVFEFMMIPFLQIAINIWLGKNAIEVNYFYATIFAIYGGMIIWNGVISSIANGFGALKTQIIFFGVGAIIKIPLAIVFVNLFNSWLGIIIASILSMCLYCIIQPIWLNRFLNKLG